MGLKSTVPPPPSMAVALGRWARQRSGSPTLARALEEAAKAEHDGHACARLDAAGFDLNALRAHSWVSDGNHLAPLVLTEHGDCFLWRNWTHEGRIAAYIADHASTAGAALEDDAEADLQALFSGVDPIKGQSQIAAVRAIVGQRFFMLSGGPGTGKTTTVLRMLLMRQRIAQRAGTACTIAMAAPTGKASQRLSQAVRKGADDLRQSLAAQISDWETALATLPDSASTLHRLLGAQPREDRFRHNAEAPLPYDLVVVDEASMVDLALMRALLDALAPSATLILIGDPDQLVSVSAGSVLADLVAGAERAPLCHQHARLDHVWRTEGRLAEVYEVVRSGNRDALEPLLTPEVGAHWHQVDDAAALGTRLRHWMQRAEWQALDAAVTQADAHPSAAFERLRALQLLTALREGPFGATDINRWIDEQRRRQHERGIWYPGRPLLVRHNDYNRRLYNGDVGIALWHENQLKVCFETSDAEGNTHYRYLLPNELPNHDLGYALTIHKSQGSEYNQVAVLLPPDGENRILSRQLLYTAISRAKVGVELWSSEASLASALSNVIERAGGLRRRLMG